MTSEQLSFDEIFIEKKEPIRFEPKTDVQTLIESLNAPITQMAAKTQQEHDYYSDMVLAQRRTKGMDSFPIEIFDNLIKHFVKIRNYRNAMLLILQANYGMRYSDIVRLRFCHIFNADGTFKEAFTLPNGELKTGKQNIYYNNNATKYIITLYLKQNPQATKYDFLFPSLSNQKKKMSLEQVEAMELYGNDIKRLNKQVCKNLSDKADYISAKCIGKISDEECEKLISEIDDKNAKAQTKISELESLMRTYKSKSPDPYMMITLSISRNGEDDIIKNGLKQIGVFALNCRQCENPNINLKLNTHSLRKTFGGLFYDKAFELKAKGIKELQKLDTTLLKLLQDKYMHSDSSITRCYSQIEEEAFKAICTRLDIGFEAIAGATGINI